MLSDEEKKAIKRLEKFGDSISCSNYPPEAYIEMKEDIEDILYLLEKQSKEIEELKNTETYKLAIIDKDNYISKDKIKAKIEVLDKAIKVNRNSAKNSDRVTVRLINDKINELYKAKEVLQSLLEKE